jgi:hypothetical protein
MPRADRDTDERTTDVAMTTGTGAPIYDSLVEELGDVPAQVRQVAEQTVREVEEAMTLRRPRTRADRRRAGSADRMAGDAGGTGAPLAG